MSFKPCADASAAGWIASSEIPWEQLVGFGPAGFAAHARLRFIAGPTRPGQTEAEAAPGPVEGLNETEQLEIAAATLLSHSSTPNELFLAYWGGFGLTLPAGTFEVTNRSFFLYRGTLSGTGALTSPRKTWPRPAVDAGACLHLAGRPRLVCGQRRRPALAASEPAARPSQSSWPWKPLTWWLPTLRCASPHATSRA